MYVSGTCDVFKYCKGPSGAFFVSLKWSRPTVGRDFESSDLHCVKFILVTE